MRNAFIDELIMLARKHNNIALIVGDLGYSVIESFADEFPDRFLNAGVSEQNMTTMAAGMASEGYHVFTYSIANFPTFRCAEQIRNDVDYHNLPVTIVAVGGGLSYGNLGYSHHAIQDYALMRCMPNMLIAAPGDPMEVRACMRYLVSNPQPSYLRLGKSGEKQLHSTVPYVSPGTWVKLSEGNSNCSIVSTGSALRSAVEFVKENPMYLDWNVHSMPLWGMRYKYLQDSNVKNYLKIMTMEDHLEDGGFGSWMLESVSSSSDLRGRINLKALDNKVCDLVASQELLNKIGWL
jgi:transketolase